MSVRRWFLALLFLTACADGKFGRRRDNPTPAPADGGTSADDDADPLVPPPEFDLCARTLCPDDPRTSLEDCQRFLMEPGCPSEAQAYVRCIGDNRVCGSDGRLDPSATLANCSSQSSAVQRCLDG